MSSSLVFCKGDEGPLLHTWTLVVDRQVHVELRLFALSIPFEFFSLVIVSFVLYGTHGLFYLFLLNAHFKYVETEV